MGKKNPHIFINGIQKFKFNPLKSGNPSDMLGTCGWG